MTRQNLIAAVAKAAEECGYAFFTGFEYRINSEADKLPAAWLIPPELTKTEGRQEGVKHYKVVLKLLHAGANYPAREKELLWARMENDAAEICKSTGKTENVRTAEGVRCLPAELSLTNRGEISMTVNFNVQMTFCDKNNRE